ncbi:MAG TPA: hypothetical protein V6C81_29165 [Planktothrix sp.]
MKTIVDAIELIYASAGQLVVPAGIPAKAARALQISLASHTVAPSINISTGR